MAEEKLPDIIPLGGPTPPAEEYEPIFDYDSGTTVYRPRRIRALPPAVKGDSNVMGWMDASGHQLARSWYGETRDDLIGEIQGARSVIRNLSSLKPLSPEEEQELASLKSKPMLPSGLFASGPYMPPQPSFTPEFTRRTELERRKNAPELIASVQGSLKQKLNELEETVATLAQFQGTTEGMKNYQEAKGFFSSLKAFADAPLDTTTGMVFENWLPTAKAGAAAAGVTAATVATGGGALVPIAGLATGATVGGIDSYDSELASKLASNPEFMKNPRAFLANLDKTVSATEQEKAFQAERDKAIAAGLTETGATIAMGGLTKLLPGGTTPVRKFLWDQLGEGLEEQVVGDAGMLVSEGRLMNMKERFDTALQTAGQGGITAGGSALAQKAGEVSGVSKLVSDAFKPQLRVDTGTLTPMAPRANPGQMAVDLNTLTPIAAPVDPAQLQINPASLSPADPAPAATSSLPNVIPLSGPAPSAQATSSQAGASLPDVIPLSGPTSTAQAPIAASRGDQQAPQGEARPQIPFAPQAQAPQTQAPQAPQVAPAAQAQTQAPAPAGQTQPGVSSLFNPPPAQPAQRQANPLAPISTGIENATGGGGGGEPTQNNVVPREALKPPAKGYRFVEVDPRLINDEHARTSSMNVRNPANVVSKGGKSKIELAKDYIRRGVFDGSAPGGRPEAAMVGFTEDGKISITDGRHRLAASEQLGAPSVTIQVPEGQADEFARRFAPRTQAPTQASTSTQAAPQGQAQAPQAGSQPQPGRRPISLAPVNNTVTNPEVGRQRPKLSVRDEAAWSELERKAAELDRRREARSQAQDRNTDPSTRRRGPEQIAQRLINELRRGGSLTHQEASAALRVTEKLMERGYLDNLAVSVSNVEKGGGVRGEYNPVTELVKLFVRNTNRPGIFKRTFAHEVSHHLERMVPAKDLEAARQQFLRERAKWLKDKGGLRQLLGDGNWLDKSFTNAQIKQFLGNNTMDASLISKYFIKDTNTGKWRLKLTDETYKFTNFSEYFAERVSEIAGDRDDARLNPQDGPRVWNKIKDMLAQIKKALIDVFGKDKVEAIWDKFQDGEYTSDFKRDKLAGYDKTGGQNPIMDDPRTADYRDKRFGPADQDRQTRVDNIDKLEPNKPIPPPQSTRLTEEEQSKVDDMRFAGESILEESAGEEEGTIAARRDEQVSMSNVEKDAKKSGKIAGATLYISSRMLEGMSFDDAFGEVVSKYGKSFSKFRNVIQQTTDRIAGLPVSEAFDEAEKLASTRYPMAVGALEDPNKRNLISGLSTILADPEKTKKSARELRKITGFKSDKSWDDQRVISEFIKHVEGNLDWLYKGMRDRLPEGILDRSKLWYVGANAIANRLAKKHSIPVEAAAGVLAVLSPQMDWYKNVSLAERALEIVVNKKNHVVDDAMVEAIMKRPSMVKLFMAIHEKKIYGDKFEQKKTKWPSKGDFKKDSKAAKALQEKLMAQAIPVLRKSGVIPVGTKMGDVKDTRLYAYLLRAYDEAYNPREYAVITPEGGTAGMSMNEENTEMNDIGWGNFDIIEKVRPLVENPTMENISRLMGGEHKVRNFYNNIIDPNADLGQVTIDTHAVAAALLEPLAGSDKEVEDNLGATGGSDYTGLSGLYPIYAQAYQNAAKKYGLLPREMQSITWEGVRGLFTNKFKNATNKATIRGHWADYASGKISLATARSRIEKTAGGFKPPTWYGRDGQSPEGVGSTQDQGNVDPRGVREGRGRPGSGRARKGSGGSSVRSARDDGENTPIPGGYRDAFFQAKKGAGAPEPKQIKFWTDLGHDPDADTTKQFLWSIDRRGEMHVISVSDLNDKMTAAGASLDNAIEAGPSDGLSEWTRIPTHMDWETLGGEYDRSTGKDLGIPKDVLSGPAHGRIDATGDVLRVSLIQKNQSTPEIKADMQRHVKEKLGEALGEDPMGLRGYDFTDAGPFTGPEVFSARDEEGADQAFKPLEVHYHSPAGKVSIPAAMGFRFGALALGEGHRPGTIRYFDMNGVTSAPTQIALHDAKTPEEKADIVSKLPHADVRFTPDAQAAVVEWIQVPDKSRKLGVGSEFARRIMFDLRNRPGLNEISFRAINQGSIKILLRGMKNSLAGRQEDFRVTSLEDARDVMDGDQTEYGYDVVISRVGADSGEGYAIDAALDRALTNGRGSEDIKRQLSLANNPGENYFPGQKGITPGQNNNAWPNNRVDVRQLPGQEGENYFGRAKMKPGYTIGSDGKVIRSGEDAPHWLDIGHDRREVTGADGKEYVGEAELWVTDGNTGKTHFRDSAFSDTTHDSEFAGGSGEIDEFRYNERGRVDHVIFDDAGNLLERGRISVSGTMSQRPDPARIRRIKEIVAKRARTPYGDKIEASAEDYDVYWYGNNDEYKAANNLSSEDQGPGVYSARDEEGDYRGSHRSPDGTNGEGSLDAMDRTYPEDIYGPNGAQYYGARRPDDVKIHKLIQSVRGNPDAKVTVYRAVPKGVGAEITPGNWVSPSREYAAEHGERFPNGYDVLERQVRAGDLFTEGNSLQEFGWNPTGEPIQSARDEEAPRKLKADPVVRGNPRADLDRPMSQRTSTYPKGEDFTREGRDGSVEAYNILGRNKASPERMRQIQEFVKDSEVKHALYRGQTGAYETPSAMLSEDGLTHLAQDPDYAAQYAESTGKSVPDSGTKSAVVQVYLNAKNIVDISDVGHSTMSLRQRDALRKKDPSGLEANEALADRSAQILDKIISEVARINNVPVESLSDLRDAIQSDMDFVEQEGEGNYPFVNSVWQYFPHLDTLFRDYGVEAIKYSDSDLRTAKGSTIGGKVSYAVKDTSLIKAAFGDNDVNPDTGNIFQSRRDEDTTDIPSTGSTARKAGLAAGALALAPTSVEAATGAAKAGATIAGVAIGDLIGVASGIAFASNDRLLQGLNPIAANMHLLANDTRSPTMRRIAEMFNRLGGNTSSGAQETYHEERDANRRVYRNKLSAAFEPLAKLSQEQIRALDITIARALAGEIPMPSGPVGQVVQNLQALSDELYRYLREAGIEVNYAKDYAIPHSFNAEAVAKDEQAFIDLAEQAYIDNNPKRIKRLQAYIQQIDQEAAQNGGFTQEMTDRKNALNEEINKLQVANPRQQAEDLAAAIMAGEEGGDQSQGLILGSNPSNQNRADFLKDRVFEQSARAMLREYFQNDPRHAWNNYIARATTLAEFARRFGSKGDTWMKLVDQMRKEGVSEKDITRIKEHVLDAMGALTPAAQGSHAMANALLGLSNMAKLRSTFLTNFLEAQAQAIPGNLTDAVTAPIVMLKEFAAILAELSPRQRALLKQYLRIDLNTETGNMELARIVGLMDAAGVHQIMENSAYALDRQGEFREDSKTDRAARAISGATSNIARAYGIEASENAKRAMGARYAAGRLDQHVSDFLRDNILARALKKVGYTGDAMTTRNEAIMRLRRAGITDQQMIAFGTWWETARNSNNFNERLADTTDPMAALARKAIRMEASRAMVNSNRAMKPGGERNKAISQDNFWGKAVMSFLNYPAAFREQVAKPMGRDIASGFRGYESEGGQSTFFSPAERARMIARASAIPAMAISAAAFLAARVMIGGDEEEKEKAGEKSLLSWLIDGLSYTGLLGGKTEAVQRARRGQLPPIVDEGVRLAKNINREGTEGNGKDRAVTKSLVNTVGVPAAELAATKLPMPLATVADQIIASKQFKEMVVNEVAGKKQEKKTGGSTSRGSGREDGRSGGRSDGR